MFSGFRNVMENLAQPQLSPDHPVRSESQESPVRSSKIERQNSRGSASFDLTSVAQSTGHLAESAFSNLRKSLAAQRPFQAVSPPTDSFRAASPSPQPERELKPVSKRALEDRLRATFAIGDVSEKTTPGPSHAPSPRPQQAAIASVTLSPKSTPLPDSRPASPLPIDLTSPLQMNSKLPDIHSEDHPLSEELSGADFQTDKGTKTKDRGFRIPISQSRPSRYPEADVPLPLVSPIPTNLAASRSSISSHHSDSPLSDSFLRMNGDPSETDDLKARLQLLETQFNDATLLLRKLTATQDAVNAILSELTPVSDLSDVESLRTHLLMLNAERNSSQDEINRLNGKLSVYDERIEELRDTHRLESRSQTESVDSLRKELEESEALLKVAQNSASQAEKNARVRQAELDQTRAETQRFKEAAKAEEEKRVKAISLLKTVRQKLVKAEKDRDDAIKENSALKEKERDLAEQAKLDKAQFEKEMEGVRAEKERDIAGLKAHFDGELASMKEKLEKELTTRKDQLELEFASTKASYQKEISAKNSKIETLEDSVRSLNHERDSLFDQLQLRQAEVESSQSMLETLQSTAAELQFQIRELTDRKSLLTEQLADARRELEYRPQLVPVSDETSRSRAALGLRLEGRIKELTDRLAEVERDGNDIETTLTRSLQQKTQEIESLRKRVDASSLSKGASEEEVEKLRKEIDSLRHEIPRYEEQLRDMDHQRNIVNELEAQLQRQSAEFNSRSEQYERESTAAKERERQARAANKSLREELRRVQNSAAFLERQRNPGVGYWSNMTRHDNSSEAVIASPTPSTSDLPSTSRVSSPGPSSNDEEINLEYLRNVILQFLEHKDMRPHLVRVLSIILHFTPQETRRLMAKV